MTPVNLLTKNPLGILSKTTFLGITMLTEIRDRSSGVFAYVIAALIIIPMAFWGVQEYANTEAQPVIVEVGDQKITQGLFQQSLAQAQRTAQQRNPSLANSNLLNNDFFKNQVLEDLIQRAVVEKIATDKNYQIGNQQLADLIKSSELFQLDGEFDQSAYDAFVQSRAYSKTQFENETRSNSRLSQVASGYQESALVLPDEVRELLEIQAEQRTFDLITIKQADYATDIVVSDEDIQAFYEDNVDNFLEPDRMVINYLELDAEQVATEVTVDADKVKALYEENKDSYISPETRTTRHILLSTNDSNEDEQLAKAQDLFTQLQAGADFAELAKEHSQDPGSASNGGSLGEVEPGVMVPEFEQATFALEEGDISEPVQSQFGYHIIKVDKINGGDLPSFEEVKADIEQGERDLLADELMLEKLDQLRNLVFEQPESLDGVATEMGLELKTSEIFSAANGSGIAANEAVRTAAFSDQVSIEGINSEPIDLGNNVYAAISKKDFIASAPKPLTEVTAQIKQQLINERAAKAAKQAGDEILAKAKLDWSSLSNDESLSIETHTVTLIDTQPKADPSVIREVMRAQLNNEATKIISTADRTGNFNIIRLNKIAPGDLNVVSEQIKDSTRELVAQRNGLDLFESYIKGLSSDLNLQINEDLL